MATGDSQRGCLTMWHTAASCASTMSALATPDRATRVLRLEEDEKLVLTPFEKNIEVWRQLWRVLERSDIIVQVQVRMYRAKSAFC